MFVDCSGELCDELLELESLELDPELLESSLEAEVVGVVVVAVDAVDFEAVDFDATVVVAWCFVLARPANTAVETAARPAVHRVIRPTRRRPDSRDNREW